MRIREKYPKPIPKPPVIEKDIEEPKPDYKAMFDARKGFWNGNVEIADRYWEYEIKGYCSHCGRQLIGYYYKYYDKEISLCNKCFDLFERFTPVLIHYYPGCVENGNSYKIHVWKGYDEFVKSNPPDDGWHYELSENHIMDVSKDHKEYWVLWIIRDDSIIEELRKRIHEWRHPRWRKDD